jgi:hypothetical protein
MFQILKNAFSSLQKKWPLVVLIYAVSFVLAFVVARPFYVTILNEANNSIALEQLLPKFDFMVFSDFMIQSGKAFRPFLPLIMILGIVYMAIQVFFAGGIIGEAKASTEKFDINRFWANSSKNFFKYALFLIFQLIFLLCLIAFSGMFFFIFASIGEGGNEKDYFFAMLPPILILLFFISFVIVLGDYAQSMIFEDDTLKPWPAFWKSFGYIFKNMKTLVLFYFMILTGGLFSLLYLLLENAFGMTSGLSIFIVFVFQQILSFIRTFLKVLSQYITIPFLEKYPAPVRRIAPTENFDDENIVEEL